MGAASLRPRFAAARCRATTRTGSRSANPASSRASSTGRAPGRCFPPPATWRAFLPRGTLSDQRALEDAMAFAQQGVFRVNERFTQALAWQRVANDDRVIVDKNGGPTTTPTHIRLIPHPRARGAGAAHHRGRAPA